MNVMKPIAIDAIPHGQDWLYEVKYDGFRCVLHWEKTNIRLISKNNKDLTDYFPEVIDYCQAKQPLITNFLPLKFDGELVVLNHHFGANFSLIQKRGRMKSKESIKKALEIRPATFMAFDLLQLNGEDLYQDNIQVRKRLLNDVFRKAKLNLRIYLVDTYENFDKLWQIIFDFKAEGMIVKRKNSLYYEGKKHRDWFKIKNWRTIKGFLTHLDTENGYFTVSVYDGKMIKTIGKCKHGLNDESIKTLKQIFLSEGNKQGNGYTLLPAICASINTLDLYKDELREPAFRELLPTVKPTDCTLQQLKLDMAMIPPKIEFTNIEKVFWPDNRLTKGDMLTYMREISPYMLPFLKEKALTVIRAPDGVRHESFFQKNLPNYAPEFIDSVKIDNDQLIICSKLEVLIWFANHGAVEFHVPFQTIGSNYPNEIVFDLDPPDRDSFDLAIKAAQILKPLLDELNLISFVKTSGNKGLQIHIPIEEGSITYNATALFTQAIAWTVENAYTHLFTTERLKKNREGRLYIDYVQHGKDKTIIAPYSPRKTRDATVAVPLYWNEVKNGLVPDQFTIENVVNRVQDIGCPFASYFNAAKIQNLDKVLKMINN